jgi:HSP20 family protein
MANLIRRRSEPERSREMAPYGTAPWNPLRVMNELLRWDPFGELAGAPLATSAFVPRFDVRETKDAYMFTADLPGLREEDVEVSVSGNTLTVSGQRQEEETTEGEQWHCAERSYGEFRRSFTLPEGADAAQASAEFKNGVLRLRVPKRAEVQPRRIAVGGKGGGSGAKA